MDDLRPGVGMTGLTHISGAVGGGIRFGQWLNREGFSEWEHAFKLLPGGYILEAEPGGAVIRKMHYAPQDVYWCQGLYQVMIDATATLTDEEFEDDLWRVADELRGVGYSFLDYDALAAKRLGMPDLRVWPNRENANVRDDKRLLTLREFVRDTGHMICSQLCDEFDLRMNVHDFTDQRWPQDVTPASLWKRDLKILAGKP